MTEPSSKHVLLLLFHPLPSCFPPPFLLLQVRGDDKLFATESAKYRLPADGDGPVAYAVRSGREQVMEKDDLRKMKRWPLIKEFGIKKIHMIPMEDGSVLEYGTPSGEEVM